MTSPRKRHPLKISLARAEPLGDIVRRVWNQSAEDNVLFLAGGLAFNILLALVPFVLLLISGLSFLLGRQPEEAARTVMGLLDQLLPRNSPVGAELLRTLVSDVLRTRGAVTIYSAIGFAWFSTRLFASLRSTLALCFDGTDRGIVAGKLFDFLATAVATLAVVLYVVISFYLDLATTQGLRLLVQMGLRESAMSWLAYFIGRSIAIALIVGLFFSLYRGLPRRRPSVRTSMVGAITAAVLFEAMRSGYTFLMAQTDAGTLYTGTIAAIVTVVFWTYYSSLVFLLGSEIAQAYDLRRGELALRQHKEAPTHEVPGVALPDRAASVPKGTTDATGKKDVVMPTPKRATPTSRK